MSPVRLTPGEARRALYVDFEGRKVGPPVLLGCTTKSRVRSRLSVWQAVTDPILTPLAIADDIEALSLADAVERILVRAERKDRLIVAWSERELDVVREHCPQHLDRFEARFRNAREFAVRWRNKCHDGRRPPTNALADYLALIGYTVPEGAGPGRVGETVEIVQRVLLRGRRVSDLTDKQLRRWDDLREHNRHDCAGMRRITILAADEIAEEDRRAQRSSRLARKPRLLRSRAGAA
ncbi:MAG TPA: hypothetical protein VIF36_03020 [Gaiellaceae bacterium]|jgi:hypothetical protein